MDAYFILFVICLSSRADCGHLNHWLQPSAYKSGIPHELCSTNNRLVTFARRFVLQYQFDVPANWFCLCQDTVGSINLAEGYWEIAPTHYYIIR